MQMRRREFLLGAMAASAVPGMATAGAGDVSEVERETFDPSGLIRVKPHLQLLGERELGVVWATARPATGTVEWSQDGGKSWTLARNECDGLLVDANDRIHRLVIGGYNPVRPLAYRVRSKAFKSFGAYKVEYSGEEGTAEGEIGALVPADGTLSFAVLNDVHQHPEVYKALAPALSGGLSFTVFNGDILNEVEGEDQIQRHLLAPLAYCAARTKAPMWYLRGNHETRGPYARHLRDYLALQNGRFYGAVTLGGVRFVFIDTGEDKPDDHWAYSGLTDFDHYVDTETDWLRREFASDAWTKARFRIAFMHIPPDADFDNGKKKFAWKPWPDRHARLCKALAAAKPSLVFGAHMHQRHHDLGIPRRPYPLVVGGGMSVADAEEIRRPTLTRCDVTGSGLRVRQVTTDGKTVADFKVNE